jgi:hypothetical protein
LLNFLPPLPLMPPLMLLLLLLSSVSCAGVRCLLHVQV